MFELIIAGLFWVALPLLFGFCVVRSIMDELNAANSRKAHRGYMLGAIETSNMSDAEKAELVCKFVHCGGK